MEWLAVGLALWLLTQRRATPDAAASVAPSLPESTPTAWPTRDTGPLAVAAVDPMVALTAPATVQPPPSNLAVAAQASPSNPVRTLASGVRFPHLVATFPTWRPTVVPTTSPLVYRALSGRQVAPGVRGY